MGKDAEGEGEISAEGEDEHKDDGAEGDDKILTDDTTGFATEANGIVEALDAVIHEDDFALFERGVAAPSAHGD